MLDRVVVKFLTIHKFETLFYRSGIWVPKLQNTAIKTSIGKEEEATTSTITVCSSYFER